MTQRTAYDHHFVLILPFAPMCPAILCSPVESPLVLLYSLASLLPPPRWSESWTWLKLNRWSRSSCGWVWRRGFFRIIRRISKCRLPSSWLGGCLHRRLARFSWRRARLLMRLGTKISYDLLISIFAIILLISFITSPISFTTLPPYSTTLIYIVWIRFFINERCERAKTESPKKHHS